MITTYQPSLVLLSFVVAIFSAFVALELVSSVAHASGKAKAFWLAGGAVAMGTGIWSMHFIGMLAFEMPGMIMSYEIVLMTLSIVVAVGASGLGLYTMSRPSISKLAIGASASAMALAIAGMHYLGMYSMRMAARIEWNYGLVVLSVLIALAASLGAVITAIQLPRSSHPLRLQAIASVFMGIAIAGMHYAGMEAATFIHAKHLEDSPMYVIASSQLTTVVTVSTLAILMIALTGSIIDRALTRQARKSNENARLYQEAEAANITKTRFLANMSHEIRTPIGAILGFTELLLGNEVSEKERQEYLGIIQRSARSLSQLIDDILDLSKIEMNKLEIENTNVVIRTFIQDILSLLRLKAEEKGLRLQLVADDNDIPEEILTDPVRLRQILVNVIGNAIKFTSHGGVTVFMKKQADHLAFEVKDTGIGMTEEQQSRIFRAFSQGDSSMTRKYGGTGLGLEISRRLAQALGGDLALKSSSIDTGSVFLATIQLREPIQNSVTTAPAALEKKSFSRDTLKGSRVLVIDDVLENQVLVRLILQKHGAIVELADNGADGIAKASETAYDVILMDIQMPVMNGFEATKILRERGIKTPVLALTAHAMREDRDACLKAGCDDHITKPIDVGNLIPKIEHYSSRRFS